MKLAFGKKLGLAFGVIVALMVFSATMSYVKSADIRQNEDRAFDVRFPSVEAARRLQRDLNQTQNKSRQTILAGAEPSRREAAKKGFDGGWSDIEKDIADMDELVPKWTLQANRDRLADVKQRLPLLRAAQEAALTHAGTTQRDA